DRNVTGVQTCALPICQQPGVAGLVGGVQRVIEVGVPVAVAPVDGKVQSAGGQFLGQGSAQAPVLPIDGADSAEVAVVGGDVLEQIGRASRRERGETSQ